MWPVGADRIRRATGTLSGYRINGLPFIWREARTVQIGIIGAYSLFGNFNQ